MEHVTDTWRSKNLHARADCVHVGPNAAATAESFWYLVFIKYQYLSVIICSMRTDYGLLRSRYKIIPGSAIILFFSCLLEYGWLSFEVQFYYFGKKSGLLLYHVEYIFYFFYYIETPKLL